MSFDVIVSHAIRLMMGVTLDCHVSCDLSVEENESTVLRWIVLVVSADGLTLLFDELVELPDSFTAPFESIDLVEEERRRKARREERESAFHLLDSRESLDVCASMFPF